MRRGRRRGAKLTWLPNWGTANSGFSTLRQYSRMFIEADTDADYSGIGILPLLRDAPPERVDASVRDEHTMADIIGSEYFLRRIVGNMFVANRSFSLGETVVGFPTVLVKTGIFIARVDKSNPNGPLSWNETSEAPLYDPWSWDANREPWIFQRSWVLGLGPIEPPPGITNAQADWFGKDAYSWPNANWSYPTIRGGPHCDIKTKRRVRQDDRLFWAISAEPYNGLAVQENWTMRIEATFDYRCLGALRRARQTGSF